MNKRIRRVPSRSARTPARPHRPRGGIRASTRPGAGVSSWWARRFLDDLERFAVESRLAKGRSYARDGQVVEVAVTPGRIDATVQGGRLKPYQVEVAVTPLAPDVWDAVADALAGRPLLAARMLAGDMPAELDELVAAAGGSLFPNRMRDVRHKCDCDDWSNPCKHTAAVYYVVGEELDRDPSLFLTLRGADPAAFLARLPGAPAPALPVDGSEAAEAAAEVDEPLPGESLSDNPDLFWASFVPPLDLVGELPVLEGTPTLLRRLGAPPFWRGRQPFLDALLPVTRSAAVSALHVLLGEREARRRTRVRKPRKPRGGGEGAEP